MDTTDETAPDHRDVVDLSSRPAPTTDAASSTQRRAWLSLFFRCASAYARAYKSDDGACYHGRCPKCAKSIRFEVGPSGTSQRTFEVSCR